MVRTIKNITGHSRIDGVVPGVRGQRAFPHSTQSSLDPFIMLDHIGPQLVGEDYFVDGTNGAHPHRGFETLTFMFEGEMSHKDSLGNKELLKSGSVQLMNAGSGIIHGGDFYGDPELNTFHEVQLWLNLPASHKMSTPEIQNVSAEDFPIVEQDGTKLRIIAGSISGKQGPIDPIVPIKVVHAITSKASTIQLDDFRERTTVFDYVLKGQFAVNNTPINEYHTVVFNNDGDTIQIEALGKGELLIAAGEPLNEPVVMGGPFVMNTTDEIDQAYSDFNSGKFGKLH